MIINEAANKTKRACVWCLVLACDLICAWAKLFAGLGFPRVLAKAEEGRDRLRAAFCPLGKVYVVGAGPGHPDLLTVRGLRVLQQATCVVHDRLVDPRLMQQLHWRVRLISVGKAPKKKRFPQSEINLILCQQARLGHTVVRLKGGDPFVFGLGGDEALVLKQASIPYEVVPGVTSAIAVPAFAGIPVTQKGIATSFCVVSGHLPPGTEGAADWAGLAGAKQSTLVILMGTAKLPLIVDYLISQGLRSGTTPAAVIKSGTTVAQKVVTAPLHAIVQAATDMGSPSIVVIGEVVALQQQLEWFTDTLATSEGASVWGEARSAPAIPSVGALEPRIE